MFFSLVFLPAKLAKTPEKKKFSTLPKAKNTFCVRHGSHERYSLGVASGAASPRRSLHRKAVDAMFEPCLSPIPYENTTNICASVKPYLRVLR